MKLAICAPGEVFGGVERQVLDLVSYYRRTGGAEPAVLLFHDGELARQLRERGLEPVIVAGRHRYDPDLVGAVGRALDASGAAVVHTHGYKATVLCGLARRARRLRLLKTEHGLPEWSPRRPVATAKAAANFALDQVHTRRFVDEVVYVSADIARRLERWHRGLRASVITNGIDTLEPSAFPRPADLPSGVVNLGIVGRVTRVKGIAVALQALARPEAPAAANLVIVGTGELVPELQALTRSLGLGERVHFVGFKSNVYDYLAHLDAVLMPSFHEGLPYALLEAMSLGRALVCSRVGGLAEALVDGRTGLLVPPGDATGWAAALAAVAADAPLRRRLGEAARQVQQAEYSLDRMGNDYLSRLRHLAATVSAAT